MNRQADMDDLRFQHSTYLVRRKVLKILGGAFHIYDGSGNLVLYSKMKAFKLREDIRIYESEEMREEILTIGARSWMDFSTRYDVKDAKSGTTIGGLQRQGVRSIFRDKWTLFDQSGSEIGIIQEDSTVMAILRRTILEVLPQKYHVQAGGREVATMSQNLNPFVYKLTIDLTANRGAIDPRLAIAGGVLLAAVEGKQD